MLLDAAARVGARGIAVAVWSVLVLLGVVMLAAALGDAPAPAVLPEGVGWDGLGATLVATGYAWALSVRAGGAVVSGTATTVVVVLAALVTDLPELRSAAAVLIAVLGAVLGVLATRPAVTVLRCLAEAVLALLVAGVAAVAAVGVRPVIDLVRFQYLVLGLSFLLLVVLVYRWGAGPHGLGRRGLVMLGAALTVVIMTLAYSEVLRRYGTPEVLDGLRGLIGWSRERLGGFPRPVQALVGIPALMWGCHLRARRRQGWWVCAFGVAATAPLMRLVADPAYSLGAVLGTEAASLALGALVGYLLIRADLFLTGSRGARARRAEQAEALRPEAGRLSPLG